MASRGAVVWAPDPFKPGRDNPRPWLVVSTDRLPYAAEESIVAAFTTQTHHPGSIAVPDEAWIRGAPGRPSHLLPWTLATVKEDLHIVGRQGTVADWFTDRITAAIVRYLTPRFQPR